MSLSVLGSLLPPLSLLYLFSQPISVSVVPAIFALVIYSLHLFPYVLLVVLFVSLLWLCSFFCICILLNLPFTPFSGRLTLPTVLWLTLCISLLLLLIIDWICSSFSGLPPCLLYLCFILTGLNQCFFINMSRPLYGHTHMHNPQPFMRIHLHLHRFKPVYMWYYSFTTPSLPLVSWLPHVSTGLSLFLSTPTLLSDPRKEKMVGVQSMKVGIRVGEMKKLPSKF